MRGTMIAFQSPSVSTPAYISYPETDSGAGVVVIQEWWGLVDHVKNVADRFADEGFVALAPDLYHGEQARSPDEARKLSMALNIHQAAEEIHAAARHLLAMPQVSPKKVGVVGFCMGGALALCAATEFPDAISACVDFYGGHSKAAIDPAKLRVPLLAHFGTRDQMVVRGEAQTLVRRISDAGKFVDAYYYDGAGHAFFNDTRPDAYDPDAASLAWDRTLAFLRDSLR
jgi:carboxymethylenebutenolidase